MPGLTQPSGRSLVRTGERSAAPSGSAVTVRRAMARGGIAGGAGWFCCRAWRGHQQDRFRSLLRDRFQNFRSTFTVCANSLADTGVTPVPTLPEPPHNAGRASDWQLRIRVATVAGMVLLAAAWVSYQAYRYLLVESPNQLRRTTVGAIDIRNRYIETKSWFRGDWVYGSYGDAVYPPASYLMLALVFNGLPWTIVKLLWFLGSLLSVGLLSRQLVRLSLVRSRWEKWFVAVLPWAMYATGAALGNGQFILLVLPLALNAVLMLAENARSTRDTLMGIVLMVAALVQPTIAAPFFWLIVFRGRSYQPALWVVLLYLILTAIAVPFQADVERIVPPPDYSGRQAQQPSTEARISAIVPRDSDRISNKPIRKTLHVWLRKGTQGSYVGSVVGGYGSVHDLLATPDLAQWNQVASLAILGMLGLWIFRYRHGDLWLLLGITAIVARIWIYHRWYDDLLLIVPLITLCRVTKQPHYSPWIKTIAAALFLWLWMFLLAPGVLYTFARPELPIAIQVTGWLVTLGFLLLLSARECRTSASPANQPMDPASSPVAPLPI